MDYGRLKDLEILSEGLKQAKSSSEKRDIEQVINRIMKTSVPIQSLREKLIKATAVNDRPAIKRIVAHINYVRQNETYGKEIS